MDPEIILKKDRHMTKEIKLKVREIPCTGCAEDMETVLRDEDGIVEVKVDYAGDMILIKYDPDEIDRHAVIEAAERVANISEVITQE